jgi:hypothetical protein
MHNKLIYIAAPYTHPNKIIQEQRYKTLMNACYLLVQNNICPITPLAMWAPMEMRGKSFNPNHIRHYYTTLLKKCDILIVLLLSDWESSKGVYDEVEIARQNGIKVRYCKPQDIFDLCEEISNER